MSLHQPGITLENKIFGIFMELSVVGDDLDPIRDACGELAGRLSSLKTRFWNSDIEMVIAFGPDLWGKLSDNPDSAPELKPFRELGYGMAKATQCDIFIHILSDRHDLNFTLAKAVVEVFGDAVTVDDETHGFRWIEARDLSGFVDGTENPKGQANRTDVAVINEGIDAGGSYVLAQRWEHHLEQFEHFDLKAQENVFGRTKERDIEMDDDEKPTTAHTARVVIEEDGEELEILRQSLPYGKASGTKGLYFLAYSAELTRIEKMFAMMFGETDGEFDAMLSYTHAVTGSYLYAPSLEQLEALAD